MQQHNNIIREKPGVSNRNNWKKQKKLFGILVGDSSPLPGNLSVSLGGVKGGVSVSGERTVPDRFSSKHPSTHFRKLFTGESWSAGEACCGLALSVSVGDLSFDQMILWSLLCGVIMSRLFNSGVKASILLVSRDKAGSVRQTLLASAIYTGNKKKIVFLVTV